MHPNRQLVVARGVLEDREEFWVVKRASIDICEDLYPPSTLRDCPINLLKRCLDVVERQ